jgi:hypothetical protein
MANVRTSIDIQASVQDVRLPAGEIGEAAGGVVSGYALREADESLSRLKQLAEA